MAHKTKSQKLGRLNSLSIRCSNCKDILSDQDIIVSTSSGIRCAPCETILNPKGTVARMRLS